MTKKQRIRKIPAPPGPPAPPPPPLTRAEVERMFLSYLKSQVETLTEQCDEWRERVAKATEPSRLVYDLDWSFSFFESAAKLAVFTTAYKALTEPGTKATMETLKEYATKEALGKASWIARSSSPCSNLMTQCQTAAYAKLAEDLHNWGQSLKTADEFYGKYEPAPTPTEETPA